MTPARLLRAADTLVQAQFAVAPGEAPARERLRWVRVHETWLPGRASLNGDD